MTNKKTIKEMLLEDLTEIYKIVYGSNGIDKFTHGELVEELENKYR